MRRFLVPLGAALALLALFVGVRVLSGDSSPTGRAESPPAAGGGSSGSEPGNAGSQEPVPSPEPTEPPSPEPTDPPPSTTNQRGVAIDSYYRYDGRRLAINYSIGVPECYGTIDVPDVVETADSVTVTLTLVPPKRVNKEVVCIDIALTKSVEITLEQPLGDREVVDGSYDRGEVAEASAPAGDGSGNQAH